MMNGYIVRRGKEYLARKNCRSTYADDCGWCWSTELQAARIYREQRSAEMAARRVGGSVRRMENGRAEE
jgi:hypothetical protein